MPGAFPSLVCPPEALVAADPGVGFAADDCAGFTPPDETVAAPAGVFDEELLSSLHPDASTRAVAATAIMSSFIL